MIQNHSTELRLHDVGTMNLPWGCVDRRIGTGLRYGVAGGVDGLVQDIDAAMALQSHNLTPAQETPAHIRAESLHRQLGGVGIVIVNHHACAAIDNRDVIAATIVDKPEAVHTAAQLINPSVTEDQVARLSEHYASLRRQGKIADPDTAKQAMAAIDTVTLLDSPHDPTASRFIVNDLHDIAVERTGQDYEFSLAAVRKLGEALDRDGLYPAAKLAQAASIRAAAVKLVLPGGTEHAPGPDIVRLAV